MTYAHSFTCCSLREQRAGTVRMQRYYDDFHRQQRSRLLRHRHQEDVIIRDLVAEAMAQYKSEIRSVWYGRQLALYCIIRDFALEISGSSLIDCYNEILPTFYCFTTTPHTITTIISVYVLSDIHMIIATHILLTNLRTQWSEAVWKRALGGER